MKPNQCVKCGAPLGPTSLKCGSCGASVVVSWRELATLVGVAAVVGTGVAIAAHGDALSAAKVFLGLCLVLAAICLYFWPAAVAAGRRHRHAGAVFALNLLLGWTFLGWVLSMVWAMMTPKPTASDASLVKACPFCAESINVAAIRCKHCGSDLGAPSS